MSTSYSTHSKTINGKRVWYFIEDRNPHVSQHTGYYSTRSRAIKAMNQRMWGETPERGDINE